MRKPDVTADQASDDDVMTLPNQADVITPENTDPGITASPTDASGVRCTWGKAFITHVQYNADVEQLMAIDASFNNWVRTCVMLHADNEKRMETECRIPDQWKEIGDTISIVTANMMSGKYKPGVYHVMLHLKIDPDGEQI